MVNLSQKKLDEDRLLILYILPVGINFDSKYHRHLKPQYLFKNMDDLQQTQYADITNIVCARYS